MDPVAVDASRQVAELSLVLPPVVAGGPDILVLASHDSQVVDIIEPWRKERGRWHHKKAWSHGGKPSSFHRIRSVGLGSRSERERRAACGGSRWAGACGSCGGGIAYPVWCKSRMCGRCLDRRSKRNYARIRGSVEAASRRAEPWWDVPGLSLAGNGGRRARRSSVDLALVTFTIPRQRDLVVARKLIVKAFGRWMTSLREFLSAHHAGQRADVPYVWVPECTNGQDGVGNVHLHALIPLGWLDYGVAGEGRYLKSEDGSFILDESGQRVFELGWWSRAVGARSRMEIKRSWDVKGRSRPVDAASAAKYLAKYVGKGSYGLTLQNGASWWVANYGRPMVGSSRGFFEVLERQEVRCSCGGCIAEWRPAMRATWCASAVRWSAWLRDARNVGPPEFLTVRDRWSERWEAAVPVAWWPVGSGLLELGLLPAPLASSEGWSMCWPSRERSVWSVLCAMVDRAPEQVVLPGI